MAGNLLTLGDVDLESPVSGEYIHQTVSSHCRQFLTWVRQAMSRLTVLLTRTLFDLLNLAIFGNLPPLVAVAAIIERNDQILMLARRVGLGCCLPGGIIKWNEMAEEALRREVLEETGYKVTIINLINVYSALDRDPRFCCVEIVYSASIVDCHGNGRPSPEGRLAWVPNENLPDTLAFDHEVVMADYLRGQNSTHQGT